MRTDRNIPNNNPEIIIHDNKKEKCKLIDVAISRDLIVFKKEAENTLKYKDLITEVHRKCNAKANVTPVIIGATGTISKSLRQYLANTPGKHEIKEMQKKKTAILGTSHKLRKVLT